MPKVLIANNGAEIEASMVRPLLATLQMHSIPILTLCGGKALCGKCAIRILEGINKLAPMREAEAYRLDCLQAGPDIRLACQSYPGRDIHIEIVNYGHENK